LQESAKYLIQLVSDNKYQLANATQLQQQITQLIQFTDSSLQSRQTLTNAISSLITNMQQHVIFHNTINQQIQLIRAVAYRLLVIRRNNVSRTVNITHRLFIVSGGLILITLTGSFMFVFYHFKKRRKAEKRLIEIEHRFQVLINGTKDLAIFMIDEKGYIMSWYEGAHRIKGYTREEIIGKHISIFYTPEDIANKEPERNLKAAVQQESFETEGWRVRKDGSRFWADVLITAVYNDEGKLQGFTKVTRDFTLHKKAEDEIKNALQKEKELNEMKSNFVSMASHEFRTPLSTVLSSVSLLELYKTPETQDKRNKHIQRIKSAVNEMVSTLEEFLSLEKIEEGKTQVKNEIFNLKNLAEHVQTKFQTDLKTGQTIKYKHDGKEEVCLDEGFINHILTNLISNAIKYSPADSEIFFQTTVDSEAAVLTVKDNGIGISQKDQQYLFQRFFRASNTGGIKGTGLGLHIVKRYIDLMGGIIHLKSELNKGTQITVTFNDVAD
jgi:PAS domain S-box-containing protein